jgi:hypothetical protein
VETNPPGLNLKIESADTITLPTTSGAHRIVVDVDQQGYAATPKQDVTLELADLANEPLRLIASESGSTIRYFAPAGFRSTLQISSDMKDWVKLATVDDGDGNYHDFELTSPTESFYRVEFSKLYPYPHTVVTLVLFIHN